MYADATFTYSMLKGVYLMDQRARRSDGSFYTLEGSRAVYHSDPIEHENDDVFVVPEGLEKALFIIQGQSSVFDGQDSERAMNLSEFSIKHTAVIGMLLIMLLVFGVFCYTKLNVEFMSDMSLPEVEVLTIYPGADASTIESDVTRILEDDFVTLPNYKSMKSTSSAGLSWITINYKDSVDPYDQLQELRYRIDSLVSSLPEGISGKPIAIVGGAAMIPVIEVAVIGGSDIGSITGYLSDEIRPLLTRIDGVSDVTVSGSDELGVDIVLRLEDLASRQISVLSVYQSLKASNVSLPLGQADSQRKTVALNYDGRLKSLDDIRSLPVGSSSEGVVIRLGDVADVSLRYPVSDLRISVDGQEAVLISVSKRSDANSLKVASAVKAVLSQMEADSGGALSAHVFYDNSKSIKTSLSSVISSGLLGVLMAIFVIFLFLNDFKATLVIAMSIPLCILFTLIGMYITGQSINLVTITGLVVALGMVVDGSIVMLEQSYRYIRRKDYGLSEGLLRASGEVSGSIFASTMTTVVVFVPMLFLSGIMGMITLSFSITLLLCMTSSLLVAVLVVPFLLKVILRHNRFSTASSAFLRWLDKIEASYKRALEWCLGNRVYVVLVSVFLFALSLQLVFSLGYTFIPSVDTGDFTVDLVYPEGYTKEQNRQRTDQLQAILEEQVPEIETLVMYSGKASGLFSLGSVSSRNVSASLVLVPKKDRSRTVQEIIPALQEALASRLSDCTINVKNGGFDSLLGYASGGGGYQLKLVGNDLDALYRQALKIESELKSDPNVLAASIDTSFDAVSYTLAMSHDYLSAMGISSYEAGMTSAILFYGVDVGSYLSGQEALKMHLHGNMEGRSLDESLLASLKATSSAAGASASFADLGSFSRTSAVSSISHTDRTKTITVEATLVSEDAASVVHHTSEYLESNPLEPGIELRSGGTMSLIEDSLGSAALVLAIAVFLVYSVMVMQFERFSQPLLIMGCVPFCVAGVVVGLLLFGSTFSLMSFLSVVSLAGTVVNNGIMLVDYMNLLRDRKRSAIIAKVDEDLIDSPRSSLTSEIGQGRNLDAASEREILYESVAEGSSSRLRPILMTTLTTMFGVVPMSLASGEGAELYAPVGQAIAGGLLTSTLITLFLIPVLYSMVENSKIRKQALKACSEV